jgi:hypothetical protein
MVRQDEFHDCAACMDGPHGVGKNHHSFCCIGTAGRSQVSASFHFNDTNPAATRFVLDIEVLQFHVAEGGDFDSYLGCGLENGCAPLNGDGSVIYGKIDHVHVESV